MLLRTARGCSDKSLRSFARFPAFNGLAQSGCDRSGLPFANHRISFGAGEPLRAISPRHRTIGGCREWGTLVEHRQELGSFRLAMLFSAKGQGRRPVVALPLMPSIPEDPVATRVSDFICRLYLDRFGKGPLHAATVICGDLVVTLLREVSTPAERAMIKAGKRDSVLTTRILWQHSTDLLFRAGVARATGREVLVSISGFEIEHDMASEVFVLAPLDAASTTC
jgi:uncharacterized protein YbcI